MSAAPAPELLRNDCSPGLKNTGPTKRRRSGGLYGYAQQKLLLSGRQLLRSRHSFGKKRKVPEKLNQMTLMAAGQVLIIPVPGIKVVLSVVRRCSCKK